MNKIRMGACFCGMCSIPRNLDLPRRLEGGKRYYSRAALARETNQKAGELFLDPSLVLEQSVGLRRLEKQQKRMKVR